METRKFLYHPKKLGGVYQKIIMTAMIAAAAVCLVCGAVGAKSGGRQRSSAASAESRQSRSDETAQSANDRTDFSVTYDFGYTKEKLGGARLRSLLKIEPDGSYTVDKEKCAEYVDYLADRYDTFGKPRRFHATLQGEIIVPSSADAVYGWKTDRQKTCMELVKMLKLGKTVVGCEPVYLDNGYGFVYEGVKSARTAGDDIGDSYIEIDLTAQHLWVYIKGKLAHECDIVSGKSTSAATITLPGVYKLWYKGRNYPLKGTNADGDSWSTSCNYWNLVSVCGVGLHDTVSRKSFGGKIFLRDGSKGCINMPLKSAEYIYNNVELGTPVVMYYSAEQYRLFGIDESGNCISTQ